MSTSIGAAQAATLTLTAVSAALHTRPQQSRWVGTGEVHWVHTERGTPPAAADPVALTSFVRGAANITGAYYITEVRADDCREGDEVGSKQTRGGDTGMGPDSSAYCGEVLKFADIQGNIFLVYGWALLPHHSKEWHKQWQDSFSVRSYNSYRERGEKPVSLRAS